jgi:hypothetical protein
MNERCWAAAGKENRDYTASTKQIRLYWVMVRDHVEDWFIFAESARRARAFHEHYEGYDKGDARSRLIVSNVTLEKFMNGTPPCHAQYPDLVQLGFQNAGTSPNRRRAGYNGEIFREGILEAIIELGRKQLAVMLRVARLTACSLSDGDVIPVSVRIQLTRQASRWGWSCDPAAEDLMPVHIGAVHRCISTAVCLHHGAIQTDSSEDTLGS